MEKNHRRGTKRGRIGRWNKIYHSHHEGGVQFRYWSIVGVEFKRFSARNSRRAAKLHLQAMIAAGDIENVNPNPKPFGNMGHSSWWN